MATVQGENGKIYMIEHFFGAEDIVSSTGATRFLPSGFRIIGQGIAETDSGITVSETTPCLNGVGILTTTDEDLHSCGITTALMFDCANMAPLVAECRVQFSDLDTKQFFFGFSDVNADAQILEDSLVNIDTAAATTITLTASDLCGFLLSSEATDDEDWHAVYNGGSATGETTSANVDLDDDAVAGDYQILRLEIDPNGTARWFIDNVLMKTLEGAVSTTTDMACQAILENLANTSTTETAHMDYIWVKAGADWTV